MSTTKEAIERFSPLERGCYVEGNGLENKSSGKGFGARVCVLCDQIDEKMSSMIYQGILGKNF